MKIHIKTTVSIPELPPDIEIESGKLGDVLKALLGNSYFSKEVVDQKTGELILDGVFRVLLNNVRYDSLTDGLDTDLRDGDTLTLTLILLGGG